MQFNIFGLSVFICECVSVWCQTKASIFMHDDKYELKCVHVKDLSNIFGDPIGQFYWWDSAHSRVKTWIKQTKCCKYECIENGSENGKRIGAFRWMANNKATKIHRLNIQNKQDCNYHINVHRPKNIRYAWMWAHACTHAHTHKYALKNVVSEKKAQTERWNGTQFKKDSKCSNIKEKERMNKA